MQSKSMTLPLAKSLPLTGVEPVTLGLLDPRSNRLSYNGRWDGVSEINFYQIFILNLLAP